MGAAFGRGATVSDIDSAERSPATGAQLQPGATVWFAPEETDTEQLYAVLSTYGIISGDPSTDRIRPVRLHPRTVLLLAPSSPDPEDIDLGWLGLLDARHTIPSEVPPYAHLVAVEKPAESVYRDVEAGAQAWGSMPFADPVRGAADVLRLGGPSADDVVREIAARLRQAQR